MTSPLSGLLAKTVGSALNGLFLDAVLTRDGPTTGPAYDPTPGAAVEFKCKAIVESYSLMWRAQGLVDAADRKVLVLAASLSTKPLLGDRITVSGIAFVAQSVSTDPAEAVWTVQGRM